ncbi:MAG: DUF5110 domain-containing protein [Caldilineae bacterium]|nr:MAG: DUF5110 domain-containing protein [Caldilineae bacterium]
MFGQILSTLAMLWEGARRVGFAQSVRTVLYRPRRVWYQTRYRSALTPIPTPLQNTTAAGNGLLTVGDVQQVHRTERGLALHCTHGYCTIEAISPEIVRFRLVAGPPMPDYFSYATVLEPIATTVEITEATEHIRLQTPGFTLEIRRHPFGLSFFDPQGRPLMGQVDTVGWCSDGVLWQQQLPEGVQLYGLGERACLMACRGRHFHLTTMDPESYHFGEDPLYINIPFLVTLYGGLATGMLFDSTYTGNIDLGNRRPDHLQYTNTGPELRVDICAGPDLTAVMDQYTALTGRMNLPPIWALGYHQSRWSYETAEIVRDIAEQFRRRRIPCDAIHFDIDYMDGFRCFTWNRQAFPDPPGLIAELHSQGFKAVGMIDPGIKVDPNYSVCVDGIEQDVFCKLPDGTLFHGPVWPGECYFPDFTNPRVRRWWGEQYRGLVEDGFDGFWNDMNEPTIFGGTTFPSVVQHDLEGRGGDHREAHSVYGMLMARATFEGLNRLRPNRRNWVFTRSGYAGIQRYASSWTGDNVSEWEHLRLTPAMLMNLGLSGLSFTGADVGGFAGTPTPELFARWISMAAFTPFYRTHTAKHTPQQEPWSFGSKVEEIARTYINWRYRLLPYIYTAFWQCSQTGLPIMRPLVFANPGHPDYLTLDDQWFFGDHLLVAPVLTPQTDQRRLHLPPGLWYDFWSDEPIQGDRVIRRSAPLDVVPLYVRSGSVLPLAPLQQYCGEHPTSPRELHLYAGSGVSFLYEDDGETLAYRRGAYHLTRFHLQQDGRRLTLTRSGEGDYVPPYPRIRLYLHGVQADSIRVDETDAQPFAQGLELPRAGWETLSFLLA